MLLSLAMAFTISYEDFNAFQVHVLVSQLGHEKSRVREKAHRHLESKMSLSLCFRLMEYKADDAETAKRLSLIKRKWVMDTNPKCTRNISLRGYPDYPWITVDSDEESFHLQMVTRFILGSHPDWPNYRVATKKWSKRRLDQVFQRALLESSFKKEFDDSMDREVGKIEDQIAVMVQKEEASWRGKDNNPLRIKHKK